MESRIRPSTRQALEALKKEMDGPALRVLFADIRAHSDEKLLGAAYRSRKPADPAIVAVTALLAPFPQTSAAKARMLAAHLEKLVGRALPIRARGLSQAVRALKAHLSEDDIRDGAFSLRVTLAGAQTSLAQKEDTSHES